MGERVQGVLVEEGGPRRHNRLTPEQVWEGGWGGGGGLEEIDGKALDREGVWGLGESHPARTLLAGWLIVFWLVGRWVKGGVGRGKGHPRTWKRALWDWHILVGSR